jgi:hypothetical protein
VILGKKMLVVEDDPTLDEFRDVEFDFVVTLCDNVSVVQVLGARR